MKKIKVLNLYAGIGGNRKLWENVKVTAVENVPEIAKIYQKLFLNDEVIIEDAHQFLLDNFDKFDFIWSSPPCFTHSKLKTIHFFSKKYKKKFPDMKLYEEIILLKHFFKGKWVVENVISYYKPLIKPYKLDGHYFWSNFIINENNINRGGFINKNNKEDLLFKSKEREFNYDILKDIKNLKYKSKIINNMVLPRTGLNVFNCAFKEKQKTLL